MKVVLKYPVQLPAWSAAADGKDVNCDIIFAGYRSAVDWPSAHYWRELTAFNAHARLILSVRPVDRWWEIFSITIMKILESRDQIDNRHIIDIV